jgi:hypothetical protein
VYFIKIKRKIWRSEIMSYVSVEELQKYSNVYGEDTLQQSYIDSAENIVNAYLGYSPTLHGYIQYFNGTGTNELQLKARPIQTILSVEINGELIPLSEFYNMLDSEFIYYNKIFPCGKRNIKVEYDAGWGTAIDDDEENSAYIPEIIKLTVLRIAALLQSESDSNIGVTSKSFADSGTRTFINTVNFDKYLIQISNYKILVI